MGDGELTEELGAESIVRYPANAPATATKSVSVAEIKAREAALLKALNSIPPVILDLENQIGALRTRIEELERRPELKYLGVFREDGRRYSEGSAVTHDGGVWIALKATTERPNHSADWQLAVKSGGQPTSHVRSDATTVRPRENGHYAKPRTP
jgi:hypothetical protein